MRAEACGERSYCMTNSEITTLISKNEPLPAGLTTTGYLYLSGYAHALPAGLKHKETRPNLENLKEA